MRELLDQLSRLVLLTVITISSDQEFSTILCSNFYFVFSIQSNWLTNTTLDFHLLQILSKIYFISKVVVVIIYVSGFQHLPPIPPMENWFTLQWKWTEHREANVWLVSLHMVAWRCSHTTFTLSEGDGVFHNCVIKV